jgi:type 1 glutamine amidotransferase
MGPNGVQELLDWINAGGGFVGFHCGCDTFHGEGDTITPYIAMIGGEFAGHGPQFFGKLIVVDKDHPAMKPFKSPYRVNDEWYYFKNLDTQNIHVLALLDSGKAAAKIGDKHPPYKTIYPIAWTKAMGEGRVFYNAMGHREDVWENPDFQQSVAGAITWANGDSALNAEPNYEAAMAQAPAKPEE